MEPSSDKGGPMVLSRSSHRLGVGLVFVLVAVMLSVVSVRPVAPSAPPPEFAAITAAPTLIGENPQPIVYYSLYNAPIGATVNMTLMVSLTANGPVTTGQVAGGGRIDSIQTPSLVVGDTSVALGTYFMQLSWTDGLGGSGQTNRAQVTVPAYPSTVAPVQAPCVGMASIPQDAGYWVVRSDGYLFANTFLGARDYGSLFGAKIQ